MRIQYRIKPAFIQGKTRSNLETSDHISAEMFPVETTLYKFHARNLSTMGLRYRTQDRCLMNFRAKGHAQRASLARDLHAFLTAWGFSSQSSLVLPSDSKRLEPLVDIILDPVFTPLRDSTASDLQDDGVAHLVLRASAALSESYRKHIVEHVWNTDELTTHLVNATFGSICPFGTAQRKGIRALAIGPDSLSVLGMRSIAAFHTLHAREFDAFRSKLAIEGHPYTEMTIAGFYLWQVGSSMLGQ